jgi:hypothetical protein
MWVSIQNLVAPYFSRERERPPRGGLSRRIGKLNFSPRGQPSFARTDSPRKKSPGIFHVARPTSPPCVCGARGKLNREGEIRLFRRQTLQSAPGAPPPFKKGRPAAALLGGIGSWTSVDQSNLRSRRPIARETQASKTEHHHHPGWWFRHIRQGHIHTTIEQLSIWGQRIDDLFG